MFRPVAIDDEQRAESLDVNAALLYIDVDINFRASGGAVELVMPGLSLR